MPLVSSVKIEPGKPGRQGFAPRAQWLAHTRSWMAWPAHPDTFPDSVEAAQRAYARVANTLSEFEPLAMVVDPSHEPSARRLLSRSIELLAWPLNDAWMRDIAPSFIMTHGGQLAGVDWGFNDYGNKDARNIEGYGNDAAVAERITRHLGIERFATPLVCEGGALVTDGEGTLMTTASVVLNPNRNPNTTAGEVEAIFHDYLGIERTIWLAKGLKDDDTDGHADNLLAFAAPGRLLALAEDDPSDANHAALADMHRRLNGARDARDRVLDIVRVPQPRARHRGTQRLALSYINFCLVNGGVLIPAFDDPRRDADARAIIAEQFPDRKAVSLPTLAIAVGGGGLHCITHEEPAPCAS